MRVRTLTIGGLLALAACSRAKDVTGPPTVVPDTNPPAIQREMRGLWIATVANIDWPSRSTLTADQQRAELLSILDRAAASGFNAIVFHVRPAADAVYRSAIEPWGAMLSGTQGSDPGYDPLAFAVQEAHARGLELHAWINPFRAGNTSDSTRLSPTHLFTTRRDLVRVYGTQLWLDPGEAAVHDHVMRVIADIVQRYDIDGLHADDYFYPYPQTDAANRTILFPDDATFARSGGGLTLADWRRANVDRFVERMYREVHMLKPTLKVGISPFGILAAREPDGREWARRVRIHLRGLAKVAARGLGRLSRPAALLVDLGAAAELPCPARLVAWRERAWATRVAGARGVSRRRRDVERVLIERDREPGRAHTPACVRDGAPAVQHDVDVDAERWRRGGVARGGPLPRARDSAGVAVAGRCRASGAGGQRDRRVADVDARQWRDATLVGATDLRSGGVEHPRRVRC